MRVSKQVNEWKETQLDEWYLFGMRDICGFVLILKFTPTRRQTCRFCIKIICWVRGLVWCDINYGHI